MNDLTFSLETKAAPAAVLAALTDFTPRRTDLWPALDPKIYRVDEVSETSAVVREGQRSPRLWAIEEYDWSRPDTVVWTARESNFCAPGSFMAVRVAPAETGGSRLVITWNRTGITLKGRMITRMVRTTKGKPIATSLGRALDALAEASR